MTPEITAYHHLPGNKVKYGSVEFKGASAPGLLAQHLIMEGHDPETILYFKRPMKKYRDIFASLKEWVKTGKPEARE
jgi:hypothetical protein